MENIGTWKKGLRIQRVAQWVVLPAVLVAVFLAVAPPRAHATLTLQLSNGTTTVTISDGGLNDLNPLAGAVTFIGPIGNYILNVSTGVTYPVLGTPSLPTLDLNSINVTSGGGGNLSIAASQTGYTGGAGSFLLGIGGTTTGTASAQAYLSSANNLFGTSTLLGSLGPFSGAFSGTTGGSVASTAPFSLTTIASISHPGPGATSFNVGLQLPEPASLLLLGSGLTIFGLLGVRRARSKETDLL